MIDLFYKGRQKHAWWLDWRGECAAIIASGPSAQNAGISKLRDRIHCVVINENYRLCPWADVLYSCDAEWWRLRAIEVNKVKALKLAWEKPLDAPAPLKDVHKIKISEKNTRGLDRFSNEFCFDEPGVIGSGMNSGFQTINITAQFGATGIALVGFDMRMDSGVHWHGNHPMPLRNPDAGRFAEWREILDNKAPQLAERGIEVINCSEVSALRSFKKLTIDQMLERWGL